MYASLFLEFLKIGAFSFGGGYAALPLIQEAVVEDQGWLTPTEFSDLISISQMTPGPIAINSATFIGQRLAGIPGALVATLGVILPSLVIVSLLVSIYLKYRDLDWIQSILKGLRPAVIALIAVAGLDILTASLWKEGTMTLSSTNYLLLFLFILAVYALKKTRLSPILIMFATGLINLFVHWLLM